MTDHACNISYSKDGAHNFVGETEHDLGATGDFQKRVIRNQFGQSFQWVLRVRVTSPRKSDLIAGSIKATLER